MDNFVTRRRLRGVPLLAGTQLNATSLINDRRKTDAVKCRVLAVAVRGRILDAQWWHVHSSDQHKRHGWAKNIDFLFFFFFYFCMFVCGWMKTFVMRKCRLCSRRAASTDRFINLRENCSQKISIIYRRPSAPWTEAGGHLRPATSLPHGRTRTRKVGHILDFKSACIFDFVSEVVSILNYHLFLQLVLSEWVEFNDHPTQYSFLS